MSEPNDEQLENPFAEALSVDFDEIAKTFVAEGDLVDSLLIDAIQELFSARMANLEVPDGDEDQANEIMSEAITELMRHCFLGGMVHEYITNPRSDEDEAFPTGGSVAYATIDRTQSAAIVLGLMNGDGVTLRLVLDRGQD